MEVLSGVGIGAIALAVFIMFIRGVKKEASIVDMVDARQKKREDVKRALDSATKQEASYVDAKEAYKKLVDAYNNDRKSKK